MTSSPLRRRALVLVALTAFLVCLPQLASARFSSQQLLTQAVGTATLAAPSAVTGTYTCLRSGLQEGVRFDVTGFADGRPSGATYSYSYEISATKGSATVTTTTSSRSGSVTVTGGADLSATRYTLTVTTRLRGWTQSSTEAVSCPFLSTSTYAL